MKYLFFLPLSFLGIFAISNSCNSAYGAEQPRNSESYSSSFPSLPSLPASTSSRSSSKRSSISSDSFITVNSDFELNPLFEYELLRNSTTLESVEIMELDHVVLTLSRKGYSFKLGNDADFIHREIFKATKIKSYRNLCDFLKKAEKSEWKKYISFNSAENPDKTLRLDEVRKVVSERFRNSYKPAFLFSELK